MADETTVDSTTDAAQTASPAKKTAARKSAAKKTAAPAAATKKAAPRKTAAKKAAATADVELPLETAADPSQAADATAAPATKKAAAKRSAAAKSTATKTAATKTTAAKSAATKSAATKAAATKTTAAKSAAGKTTASKSATSRSAASRTATKAAATAPETDAATDAVGIEPVTGEAVQAIVAEVAASKRAPAKRAAKKAASAPEAVQEPTEAPTDAAVDVPAKKTTARAGAAKKAPAKRAAKKAAPTAPVEETMAEASSDASSAPSAEESGPTTAVLFQPPAKKTTSRRRTRAVAEPTPEPEPTLEAELVDEDAELEQEAGLEGVETADQAAQAAEAAESDESADGGDDEAPARRRRRRGGRRRRKGGASDEAEGADADSGETEGDESTDEAEQTDDGEEGAGGSSRRRRRRRRAGESAGDHGDDPENTVTRVRESRPLEQQITAVSGSTRLEAKKQRRREGREAGRRRAPIVSEAEFLARRESVERVMVIRQRGELTQIGVLEDKVLVEHYVARESQTSLIGNIYLGRVQNVLPSMEAAFIDIGKGRNAVLYAGEVNWPALGWREGQPRKIESVLTSGQPVLVQVTKDPIGHKGARLTSQISLAGRFLVYVPDGTTSGISRKLPDTERNRLKTLLKEIVPDTAGVIVRTAAEGASEDELTRDVERLKARWDDIEAKSKGNAPQLLYGEPDLTLKVVRDLFTEDFTRLVIQGDDAWDTVQGYVAHVAPDLEQRLERFTPGEDGRDAFAAYRIDEQIAKGLDRKVWLPSGGSLIIDRTEAMTVIDVNTGKFTGSGGNLEETVTKNNLEAAEEIVRQLRLRDIGGIIVVDFIDMVLESNRDLVLRRLVECLGRDRTRHQVAEVTSLGLVQMTRKRIGTGLLEAFSETCSHCQGRGIVIHEHPVEEGKSSGVLPDEPRRSRRSRGGRGKGGAADEARSTAEDADAHKAPSPADLAAMARHHDEDGDDETVVIPAADEAVETPAATEDAVTPLDPVEVAAVGAVDVVAIEPEPDQPEASEPAKPTVVTRTRSRRGASRSVVTAGEATVVEAPVAAVEPAVEPTTAEVGGEPATAPAAPKVVTRTRRGASRAVTTAAPVAVPTSTEEAGGESAPEPVVEHVPVKKRSRKR